MSASPNRVVAFVDIIGWKQAFQIVGHDKLVKVAESVADYKRMFSAENKDKSQRLSQKLTSEHGIAQPDNNAYLDISFSFVSDCFVISASDWNLKNLFNVTRWACMQLLEGQGFPTRGGITFGRVTHDTERDIIVGMPVAIAVDIEQKTKMPRIEIHESVNEIPASIVASAQHFIYNDGERDILNICNRSPFWMEGCNQHIQAALSNGLLTSSQTEKWKYLEKHLPQMQQKCSG